MTNLILCGGSGTRLWPLSRSYRPKQFLPLFAGKTLFEKTVLRNQALTDSFLIVTGASLESTVRQQMEMAGAPAFEIFVEPVGRNTAPALALACLSLPPDELVFVTPSDHLIADTEEYRRAVARASELAAAGALVTFGIKPAYPETGYGYIEHEGESVLSFREKPDESVARQYCADGRHLWNSGMFLFRAGVLLREMELWAPKVLNACRAAGRTPTREAMEAIPSISIDYAVFEKSDNVRVVSCNPAWSDVGSFDALAEQLSSPSLDGNVVMDGANPLFLDAKGNMVIAGSRKVVLVDVEELIVVDAPDAVLIMKKGSGQKLKTVTEALRSTDPELLR